LGPTVAGFMLPNVEFERKIDWVLSEVQIPSSIFESELEKVRVLDREIGTRLILRRSIAHRCRSPEMRKAVPVHSSDLNSIPTRRCDAPSSRIGSSLTAHEERVVAEVAGSTPLVIDVEEKREVRIGISGVVAGAALCVRRIVFVA